jgi:hypothetical protein
MYFLGFLLLLLPLFFSAAEMGRPPANGGPVFRFLGSEVLSSLLFALPAFVSQSEFPLEFVFFLIPGAIDVCLRQF